MKERGHLPWAVESQLHRAVRERVERRAKREHSTIVAAAERELAALTADVALPEAAE
jgi:hypothetical protein